MTDAWPPQRRRKHDALKEKAELAERFFKLLKPYEGSMMGTRHAAENSYCLFCEPKGYDHWKDQQEHAPRCEFVAVMKAAKELLK